MSKAQRTAALHQLSAAEEHGSVRYGLTRHPAIVIAIKDHTIGHQLSAQSYYAYAREQLGISEEDQFFA
jgi:transcription elongation GreA/GreB family factor